LQQPAEATLVVPGVLLAEIAPGGDVQPALDALARLGFRRVRVLEEWEDALRRAVLRHAQESPGPRPMISPVCPAAVKLIQTRFPSLLGHVAPFLTPVEAARQELSGGRVVFAAACPAQQTALGRGAESVALSGLRKAVLPLIGRERRGAGRRSEAPAADGPADAAVLRISGMRHVVTALDEMENGLLAEECVIELFACAQGCFGTPLAPRNPFAARRRWLRLSGAFGRSEAAAAPREAPLAARPGMRLDADMRRAMEKLAEIDRLTRRLGGRDCGVCGAPTCSALAEDIVLGRVAACACPYVARAEEGKP